VTVRSGLDRSAAAGPNTRDGGMVTAELAVALPALVLVLLTALYAVTAVTAQLRCTAAAAAAARLAGRGEPAAVVRQAALADAPGGAALSVTRTSTTVTARIAVRLRPPGFARLPGLSLTAQVVAAREPGSSELP